MFSGPRWNRLRERLGERNTGSILRRRRSGRRGAISRCRRRPGATERRKSRTGRFNEDPLFVISYDVHIPSMLLPFLSTPPQISRARVTRRFVRSSAIIARSSLNRPCLCTDLFFFFFRSRNLVTNRVFGPRPRETPRIIPKLHVGATMQTRLMTSPSNTRMESRDCTTRYLFTDIIFPSIRILAFSRIALREQVQRDARRGNSIRRSHVIDRGCDRQPV